jgi:hypothetical protein
MLLLLKGEEDGVTASTSDAGGHTRVTPVVPVPLPGANGTALLLAFEEQSASVVQATEVLMLLGLLLDPAC